MTRIATTSYRYKRPPPKRKAVALEVPAVVTAKPEAARDPTAANADRKSAIGTARQARGRFGAAPDMTPEELQRRGEAADAMWRGLVDRATAKDGKSAVVSAEPSSSATKPAIVMTARKRRSDAPHLPMELPLSRKPIERDGDEYKRMKAAMARRLRGEAYKRKNELAAGAVGSARQSEGNGSVPSLLQWRALNKRRSEPAVLNIRDCPGRQVPDGAVYIGRTAAVPEGAAEPRSLEMPKPADEGGP